MSDNSADQVKPRLERQNRELGRRELVDKEEPTSIEEAPWFQYVQDRVALERELEKPDDPNIPAEMQQQHRAALEREIAILKQQHANDSSTNQTTVQPSEAPGFQPRAYGERAISERAETSPEKKDKEIYLAEQRLSRL